MGLLGKKKKNFLIINVDQYRADFVKKNKDVHDVVKKGVFFSNMITYAPYTVGAMHAIFSGTTGKYNGANNYYGSGQFKADELATMAEYFQKNGFTTYGDTYSEICLPKKGIDHFTTFVETDVDHLEHHQEVLKNIDNSEPWFCYLHYGYIHTKLMKDVLKKYDDFSEELYTNTEKNVERYDTYTQYAADYMNGILQTLKDEGMYENTIVVFLADHGSSLGEVPGEKAYGCYCYQYTINTWVTFLNTDLEAKEISTQIPAIDILPTVLEMYGFKTLKYPIEITGKSLYPLIEGKETTDRIAFTETAPLGGGTPSPETPIVKSVTDGTWKFMYNLATGDEELYNLKKDPKEKDNVISDNPEIHEKHKQLLEQELIY